MPGGIVYSWFAAVLLRVRMCCNAPAASLSVAAVSDMSGGVVEDQGHLHCGIARTAAGSENVEPGACNDGRTAADLQRQSAPQLLKAKDELACTVNNKKRGWARLFVPVEITAW
jgi:hypothetical protein